MKRHNTSNYNAAGKQKNSRLYMVSPTTKIQFINARVKIPGIVIAAIMLVFGIYTLSNGILLILAWRAASGNVLLTLIGVASLLLVYPVYRIIINEREERFASGILQLFNEIVSEETDE